MAFSYKASITIDSDKVGGSSGSLSNFPVLVSGTYDGTGGEPDLRTTGNGGNVENANGYDIYYYSDSDLTTKLDHEIQSYSASTGAIVHWVEVPTLNKGSDTTIYMAYGDSGISADPTATGTWDSSYQSVYHLQSDSGDSTSNGYDGSDTNITYTTGKIGNSASMSGTGYIDLSTTALDDTGWLDSGNDNSVQCWVRLDTINPGNNTVFWEQNTGAGTNRYLTWFWDSHETINFYPNALNQETGTVSPNTWYHIVATVDGSSNGRMWVNGTEIETAQSYTPADSSGILQIGRMPSNANQYHEGDIDEWRLQTGYITADEVTAHYNTQNSPSTFYTMGSETEVGGGGGGIITPSGFSSRGFRSPRFS